MNPREQFSRAVAGAMMSRPSIIPDLIASGVSVEWFAHPESVVVAAMMEMHREKAPIDLVTVTARLNPDLSNIGGPGYIAALEVDAPFGNEKWHAGQLRKIHLERQTAKKLRALLDRFDAGESEDIGAEACTMLHEIATLNRPVNQHPKWKDLAGVVIDRADEACRGIKSNRLYATGLRVLDEGWGGYPAGLITIAGPTGGGKSALGLQSALAIAEETQRTALVFSLEMECYELFQRGVSQRGVHMSSLVTGRPMLTGVEFQRFNNAVNALQDLPMDVRYEPAITFPQMRAAAQVANTSSPLGCVVIDYLQLVTPPARKDMTEERALSDMAREAKIMSGELGCPVFILSQVNDAGQISRSRAIGHHSDVVLVTRPSEGKILVAKWRNAPSDMLIDAKFNGPFVRFE